MTQQRRARNEISRTEALALRAAELYDTGIKSHDKAAQILSEEFGRKISGRTCKSWFNRDYKTVEVERLKRREDTQRVRLIVDAARGSGGVFAEAGLDLLAKSFYDLIKSGAEIEPKAANVMGRNLAKVLELQIEKQKLAEQAARREAADSVRNKVEHAATLGDTERQAILDLIDEKMLGKTK